MNALKNETLSEKVGTPQHLTDSYTAALTSETSANANAFRVKHILAVVKPSRSSAEVLKHAGWLAFQLGCEITLFHAVPKNCTAFAPAELQAEFIRITGMSPAQIRAILVRPDVRGFSPILEAARDEHADLVVLPADFYKEPLHFWQTNTLENLVNHLQCPVLIVSAKSPSPNPN